MRTHGSEVEWERQEAVQDAPGVGGAPVGGRRDWPPARHLETTAGTAPIKARHRGA